MSERADRLADWMEFSITLALDAEILIRICSYLPDWRRFFSGNANRVDLLLAVVTTILILPGIFETAAYAWLTIFQIARFYRVILAIPRTRRLLVRTARTSQTDLHSNVIMNSSAYSAPSWDSRTWSSSSC
jgi:hypothetical protein